MTSALQKLSRPSLQLCAVMSGLFLLVPVFGPSPKSTAHQAAGSQFECTDPKPGLPLQNIGLVKKQLIAYHDCSGDVGCYESDLDKVGTEALAFLKDYLHSPHANAPKPAIVIDVDETALNNWEYTKRMDFAFDHDEYLLWEEEARAPAVKSVLALFNYARENNVATFFVTGRGQAENGLTAKDLEAAGYHGWTRIITRNKFSPKLAEDFKSAQRKAIEESGYTIVLNIGDQCSDLEGGHALKSFKLSNPFYYVP
jgi:HAD superfamily, subfamily IIIB (Acid phosphatase)